MTSTGLFSVGVKSDRASSVDFVLSPGNFDPAELICLSRWIFPSTRLSVSSLAGVANSYSSDFSLPSSVPKVPIFSLASLPPHPSSGPTVSDLGPFSLAIDSVKCFLSSSVPSILKYPSFTP